VATFVGGNVPKLTIHRGANLVREVDLDGRELLIGRGDQSDVVLPDPTMAVSRVHAKLRQENGAYVLIDNGSQNGIWSEGEPHDQIVLEPGLKVTIGEYTLTLDDAAPTDYGAGQFSDGSETVYAPAPFTPKPPFTPPPPPRPAPSVRLTKAMLFGGCAVVLVVGLGLSYFMPPSGGSVGGADTTTATAPATVSVPATDPKSDDVAKAKQLIAEGKYVDAIKAIDVALADLPGDPDLLELRQRATTEGKPAANTTIPSGPGTRPPAGRPPNNNCLQGESPSVCTARLASEEAEKIAKENKEKRLADLYASGKDAMDSGNFRAALAPLQRIEQEEPGYRDVAALLARARDGLKKAAQQEFQAAANAEGTGDLMAALQHYQRAGQLDSSLATQVAAAIKALRDRMTPEGEKALANAKTNDAYDRVPDAIQQYDRAYQYLPEDHPGKKLAKDRLDVLRGRK